MSLRQPQQPLNGENAKLTDGHFGKRVKHHGGKGSEDRERVSRRSQNDDAQLPVFQVLLIPEILIRRHERVELQFRRIEQRPVIEIRPSTLMSRLRGVTGQQGCERPRQVAIERTCIELRESLIKSCTFAGDLLSWREARG
ncbi:MAG: hypothetical protein HEQ38_04260 [Gemmatimonas sp.]|nr:hypothetical protein [Gemmatimonas sp.]